MAVPKTTRRGRRGRPPRMLPPTPRQRPRDERAAATFDAIVIAAERALADHGLAGLTTNRIAEIAGVSIGSVYQYFPNKEAIAAALIERYRGALAGAIARAAPAPEVPPRDALAAIAGALVEVYEQFPRIHRHLRDLRAAAGQQAAFDRMIDDVVGFVAGYLRSRRDVAVPEPEVTAFAIVHAVDGVINAYAVRELTFDVRRLGEEIACMIAHHLEAR